MKNILLVLFFLLLSLCGYSQCNLDVNLSSSNDVICSGTPVTLTATASAGTPGYSYVWSTGETTQSISVNRAGTYTVSVSDQTAGCQPVTRNITITSGVAPEPPTAQGGVACPNTSTTLTATAPGGTYQWYDAAVGGTFLGEGQSFNTPPITAPTTFYVQTTISGCTSTRTPVNVSMVADPVGQAGSTCAGSTATLTATGANSYEWYDAPSGGNLKGTGQVFITPVLTVTTTYYLVGVTNGCTSSRVPVTATVNAAPPAPGANSVAICTGSATTLLATGVNGVVFDWFDVPTGGVSLISSPDYTTPTLTATTTYYVQVTLNGCQSPRTAVVVTVNPIPPAPAATANGSICPGTSAQLSVTNPGGDTYQWFASATSTNVLFTGAVYNTPNITASTTYYVRAVSGTCSSSRTAVNVAVTSAPDAPTADGAIICSGSTVTLTATAPGGVYEWFSTANGTTPLFTGDSFVTPALTSNKTYYVRTTLNGCTSTRRAVTVTVLPAVAAPIAPSDVVCSGSPATLTASGGGTYQWYDAATGGNLLSSDAVFITPALTATTAYYVQTTTNGCTSPRKKVTVTVNQIPSAPSATSNGPVCANTSARLTVTNPGTNTYQWFESAVSTIVLFTGAVYDTPNLTVSTTYYVQAVNGPCISPRTAVNVTVNPVPATPAAADKIICSGSSATLTATAPGGTYQWYDVATGGTPLITGASFTTPVLTTTTTYYVQTTLGGCISARKAVQVTVDPPPAAPVVSPSPASTCYGSAITLSASGGSNYEWYAAATGGIPLSTGANYTTPVLTATTTYYVQAIAGTCVSSRTAVTVTVNLLPNAPTVTGGTTICKGSATTLTASGSAGTYQWYDAPTGGNLLHTTDTYNTPVLNSNTSYYVQTTVGGCISARTQVDVVVTTVNAPTISAAANICYSSSTTLTATAPGGTYEWFDVASGGTPLVTGTSYTTPVLTANTTYYVQATTGSCTSARKSVTVIVNPPVTAPTASPQSTCYNSPATLTASGGGTYQWYDVATGGSPLATGSSYTTPALTADKTYYVQSTVSGCISPRTTVQVTVSPQIAVPFASNPAPICPGTSTSLTASGSTGTYEWYDAATGGSLLFTGATYNTPNLSSSTDYYVQATDGTCVSNRKLVSVSVISVANPQFQYPTGTYCATDPDPSPAINNPGGTFSASPGGLVFLDAFGKIDLSASTPGVYTITYQITGTCPNTTTAHITIVTTPDAHFSYSGSPYCQDGTNPLPVFSFGASAGTFSSTPGGLVFANTSTGEIDLSASAEGTYTITNTIITSCLTTTQQTTITIQKRVIVDAGPNQLVASGGTVTLAGSVNMGGVTWSALSGNFSNANSTSSTYTPTITNGTVILTLTSDDPPGACGPVSDEVTITVRLKPGAPTASSTSTCYGTSVTLTASGGGTYQWYDALTGGNLLATGASYATPALTSPASYYVQTTVNGIPSDRTKVDVAINSLPIAPTVATPPDICYGTSVTLTTSSPGAISWYNVPTGGNSLQTGATFITPNLTASTTYYVQTNDGTCNSLRTPVTVNVKPIVDAPSAGSPIICYGSSTTLTATAPGGDYEWFDVAAGGTAIQTGASFTTPALTANTNYYVQTTINGCTSPRIMVTVTVVPPVAAPTVLPSPATACYNSTATLTASGGSNYQWFDVPTGGIPLITGATFTTPALTTDKTYYVQAITTTDCVSDRTMVTVTVLTPPAAPIASNPAPVCPGSPVSLTASGSGTIEWYSAATGGSPLFTGSPYNIPGITSTTTYYVQVNSGTCVSTRIAVTATVNPPSDAPGVNPVAPACNGSTATLTAVASGGTFEWFDVATGGTAVYTGSTFTTPALTANTTYYVQNTTVNGCSSSRTSVLVTVMAPVTAPTAPPASTCSGTPATLTASGAANYQWFDVPTGGAVIQTGSTFTTPALTATTTYYVQTTVNGCESARTPVPVTIDPLVITVSGATSVCKGGTTTLTASGTAGTYQWYNMPVGGNLLQNAATFTTPTLTTNATYYVQATLNNCVSPRTQVNIVVNPVPVITSAATGAICSGVAQNYTITSDIPATYTWSRAQVSGISNAPVSGTSSSLIDETLINTTTTNKTVTYIITPIANGCPGTPFTYDVTVYPTAAVTSGVIPPVCNGTALGYTIKFNMPVSYFNWSRAAVPGIRNAGVSGQSSATIREVLYNTTNAPIDVTYVFNYGTSTCAGAVYTLTVTINPPIYRTSALFDIACSNVPQNYVITSNVAAATFNWSRAPVPGISNPPVSGQTSGTINETLINTTDQQLHVYYNITLSFNGCQGETFPYHVAVNPQPATPVPNNNGPVCAGNTIQLQTAPVTGATYLWAGPNGFTSSEQNPSIPNATDANAGVYSLKVTVAGCESFAANTTVVINQKPVVNAGEDQAVCPAVTEIDLHGDVRRGTNGPAMTGLWNTVSGSGTFSAQNDLNAKYFPSAQDKINGSVILSLTSTSTDDCTAVTDEMKITFELLPAADAGPDRDICNQDNTVQLNGEIKAGTGSIWTNPSGTGTFIQADQPNAVYIPSAADIQAGSVKLVLTAINAGVCYIPSDEVILTFQPPPIVSGGGIRYVAKDATIVLTPTVSDENVQYSWSPDIGISSTTVKNPVITGDVDRIYTLTVTDILGCESSLTIQIIVAPEVIIPNTFTPNADGNNDLWEITGLIAYTNASVDIFNRYGQKVFHSVGYGAPWDGTDNGKPLPFGTYYYVIDTKVLDRKYAGYVAIVR